MRPQSVTRHLIAVLDDRAQDVLTGRFGLDNGVSRTLESIGKRYGITRERVRQIENAALKTVRGSAAYARERPAFDALAAEIERFGGVAPEDDLLRELSRDEEDKSHCYFLLVLGDDFIQFKEDDHCAILWCVDARRAEAVREALRALHKKIKPSDILGEEDVLAHFKHALKEYSEDVKDELLHLWLKISKVVGKNIFGEWGHASSAHITPKGMRDYAFLVLRRQGSPMHFREVARSVKGLFGRDAHAETVHNELIKDNRFVLVGRGLYALMEWGYNSGVVRDVIRAVIEGRGPMTKDDIVRHVLKERYVKENTIAVNLQNKRYFTRLPDRRYTLVV